MRKFLFSHGFRYRKHDKRYPGTPDIVLPKYKSVIFVHGCFWHMHEGHSCFVMPKSNQNYWRPKLERNKQRDSENISRLQAMGWNVILIWECELKPASRTQTLDHLLKLLHKKA